MFYDTVLNTRVNVTVCALATSCCISDVPFQWEKGNFDTSLYDISHIFQYTLLTSVCQLGVKLGSEIRSCCRCPLRDDRFCCRSPGLAQYISAIYIADIYPISDIYRRYISDIGYFRYFQNWIFSIFFRHYFII